MSSVFQDPSQPPDPEALDTALGPAAAAWERALALAREAAPGAAFSWKHYRGGLGWQGKVGTKKRVALWLVPHAGSFLAALAVPEAALAALATADLPPDLVEGILASRKLPEGRAARLEVRGLDDLAPLGRLLALCTKARG